MNEEGLRKRIRSLLDAIQSEADPDLLNRARSIFRQEVSFFRRSYMAAYLLLLAEYGSAGKAAGDLRSGVSGRDSRSRGREDRNKNRDDARNRGGEKNRGRENSRDSRENGRESGRENGGRERNRPASAVRNNAAESEPARYLSEEESVRLFISIGRNRKVFPRDLSGLIQAKSQVSRDDLGNIRTLDNYSFVQVRTAAADTVIAALNGQNFRGRTLSVNYARNREDEGDERQEDRADTFREQAASPEYSGPADGFRLASADGSGPASMDSPGMDSPGPASTDSSGTDNFPDNSRMEENSAGE